jgi:hypothetical protein
MQSRDAKTGTESLQNRAFSSKFGLPVNNTVKKEELMCKTRNCLLESIRNLESNRRINPIRVSDMRRIVNLMGDQYRWKIGIDGGIDGRSVEMEDR